MRRLQTIIGIVCILFIMQPIHATSFITDCADDTWRYDQADVVPEGTVLSSEPYSYQGETHTKTVFRVDFIVDGNYTNETIVVDQIGNSDTGPIAISLTIDYNPGEQYRLELIHNEENPGTYSTVCGEMSVMKLETPSEHLVTSDEQAPVSLWTRIAIFFKNLFS